MKNKRRKPVGFFIEAYDTFYTQENRRFLCNDGEFRSPIHGIGNGGVALKLYKHEKRAINRAYKLRHCAPHIRINYTYEGETVTSTGEIIKPQVH